MGDEQDDTYLTNIPTFTVDSGATTTTTGVGDLHYNTNDHTLSVGTANAGDVLITGASGSTWFDNGSTTIYPSFSGMVGDWTFVFAQNGDLTASLNGVELHIAADKLLDALKSLAHIVIDDTE